MVTESGRETRPVTAGVKRRPGNGRRLFRDAPTNRYVPTTFTNRINCNESAAVWFGDGDFGRGGGQRTVARRTTKTRNRVWSGTDRVINGDDVITRRRVPYEPTPAAMSSGPAVHASPTVINRRRRASIFTYRTTGGTRVVATASCPSGGGGEDETTLPFLFRSTKRSRNHLPPSATSPIIKRRVAFEVSGVVRPEKFRTFLNGS